MLRLQVRSRGLRACGGARQHAMRAAQQSAGEARDASGTIS